MATVRLELCRSQGAFRGRLDWLERMENEATRTPSFGPSDSRQNKSDRTSDVSSGLTLKTIFYPNEEVCRSFKERGRDSGEIQRSIPPFLEPTMQPATHSMNASAPIPAQKSVVRTATGSNNIKPRRTGATAQVGVAQAAVNSTMQASALAALSPSAIMGPKDEVLQRRAKHFQMLQDWEWQ